METLLAIFTCRSCSSALLRHYSYFLNQKADQVVCIVTEDTGCTTPVDVERLAVGSDSYIDGDKLPRRMLDTMDELLKQRWDVLILAEYDTLFFSRIPVEQLDEVAAHEAGRIHHDYSFYHNPYCFSREAAQDFIGEGWKVIGEGICEVGSVFASPDIFFGLVCHRMRQPVQDNLWTEFTRNSLDCAGDLDRARMAYHSGIDILHGVKTETEIEYILS